MSTEAEFPSHVSDLPLQRACMGDNVSVVEELLRTNADINVSDHFGYSPVHAAIESSRAVEIMRLLEKAGCDLNKVGLTSENNQFTALHIAIFKHKIDVIDFLLSRGVDTNIPDGGGNTPLHASCDFRKKIELEIVQQLMEAGADPNIQNKCGETPLFEAAFKNAEHVRCLLDHRADPTITNNLGQTALFRNHIRFGLGDYHTDDNGIIEMLVDVCPLDIEDINGNTALLAAVHRECAGDVKMLLDKGGNINHRDRFGATPLHISTACRKPMITLLLLERRADCSITDDYGADALHWAAWNGKKEIVKALLDSGKFPYNRLGNCEKDYLTLASWRLEDGVLDLFVNNDVPQIADMDIWPDNLPSVDLDSTGDIDVSSLEDLHLPPLISVLDTPGVGRLTPYPEVDDLKRAMRKLMDLISERVGELCPLLKCTIQPSGSSNEDTKCGLPNEFDFLFCLDRFAEDLEPMESDTPGYAILNFKQHLSNEIMDEYKEFILPGETVIRLFKVFSSFAKIIKTSLNTRKIWYQNSLPFILKSYNPKGPHLVIRLLHRGKTFTNMDISIDVVPAVYLKGWRPHTLINHSTLLPDDVLNLGCHLVVKRNDEESLYLISVVARESYIMKHVPGWMKDAYMLLKCMRHKRMWPPIADIESFRALPDTQLRDSLVSPYFHVHVSNAVTTYMIKTIFFSQILKQSEQEEISEKTNEQKTYKLVAQILDILFESCVEKSIPSFFVSDVNLTTTGQGILLRGKDMPHFKTVTRKKCVKVHSDKQSKSNIFIPMKFSTTCRQMYLILILKYLYFRDFDRNTNTGR